MSAPHGRVFVFYPNSLFGRLVVEYTSYCPSELADTVKLLGIVGLRLLLYSKFSTVLVNGTT